MPVMENIGLMRRRTPQRVSVAAAAAKKCEMSLIGLL